MKKFIAFLLLTATLNFSVAAQQNQNPVQKDELSDSVRRMMEFSQVVSKRIDFTDSTGNILTRMRETEAVALDYPPETKLQEYNLLKTFLMDYAAKLGNYADAIRYKDLGEQKYPLDAPKTDALAGYKSVAAVAAISQAAEKSQIVIVNEAHHVPQHRAFTTELLKELKKKGYKYLAAEALLNAEDEYNKIDIELNQRGYPVKRTTTFSEEPVLGEMFREALRLGYTLVPYDAGLVNGKINTDIERERGAAENIKNRILKNDPNAKILIHVGFTHNSENEKVYRGGGKAMAGYLKEFTGIDPLTVDQTEMTEHSSAEYERPLYRVVAARKDFTQPVVFQNSKGEFWKLPNSGNDITVFSPRTIYKDGRPHWLAASGSRRIYNLPPNICGAEKNCLVRARYAVESADATPIDQIEARAGRKNVLLLPKGKFTIEVEDEKGAKLKTWHIKK